MRSYLEDEFATTLWSLQGYGAGPFKGAITHCMHKVVLFQGITSAHCIKGGGERASFESMLPNRPVVDLRPLEHRPERVEQQSGQHHCGGQRQYPGQQQVAHSAHL